MSLTAVILAGGQGVRMGGRNKALLRLGAESLIRRQLRLVSEAADEQVVVVNDPAALAPELAGFPHARIVPDRYVGAGPLAGLHAGLAAANRPAAWVLGCDHPAPDPRVARLLRDRLDEAGVLAVVPTAFGKLQPLHAVYRTELAAVCETLLRRGERRLAALLDRIPWAPVPEDALAAAGLPPTFADDIDTPEDYARFQPPADALDSGPG